MDTLTSIEVFHQVVKQGSFTKAADALGISIAMTSKHISHLERSLGAKLLHRNSRNLHLTQAGEQYHQESLYALEILHKAAQTATGAAANPQGELKITMPLWFANTKVATWLHEFNERYPKITLNLFLSNQKLDLVAQGYDLALRLSNDPHPSMIIRPLGVMPFYPVASPDYLAKHGTPHTADDINQLKVVQPSYVNMQSFDITHRKTGTKHTIQCQTSVHSNDTIMSVELIKAGFGVGFMPSWVVEQPIAAGELVPLLPEYQPYQVNMYAAYVDRAFLSAKVRAFIDFWVEKCSEQRGI